MAKLAPKKIHLQTNKKLITVPGARFGERITFSVATGSFEGHLSKCLNNCVKGHVSPVTHIVTYRILDWKACIKRGKQKFSITNLNFTNQGTPSYLTESSEFCSVNCLAILNKQFLINNLSQMNVTKFITEEDLPIPVGQGLLNSRKWKKKYPFCCSAKVLQYRSSRC